MFRKASISASLILLLFIFIGVMLSQDRGRGYEMFLERLKQELSLTPEQVVKIQKILNSAQKQAELDREKYQGDREAMMRAMRERWEKIDKEIESVLTKEQRKKYELIKKEREQRYRGRRPS